MHKERIPGQARDYERWFVAGERLRERFRDIRIKLSRYGFASLYMIN